MPPLLEQTTYNSICRGDGRTVTATFSSPTKPGSLLVIVAVGVGDNSDLSDPSGFTLIAERSLRQVQMSVWYQQASPTLTAVSVTALDDDQSLQLRAFEYSGMAQTSVVDKVRIASSESPYVNSGNTGVTAQADELVLCLIANQHASCSQYGFLGNLSRLFEHVSPQSWRDGSNEDWERSRLTIHQAITVAAADFSLLSYLSSWRRWLSIIITFRGGSFGPARFTSRTVTTNTLTTAGRGSLTVFGPLISANLTSNKPMIRTSNGAAHIGPFNYQYRLGGWSGMLIGSGTPFYVQSTEGLGGWQIRTSDDDLPRGDGALRGIDLESARTVVFKLNVGLGRLEAERNMEALLRALVPQRDVDFELIWRHPTQTLRMMRVRPVDLVRLRSSETIDAAAQTFALRAADPRHYSAVTHLVKIPVTPTIGDPLLAQVTNLGNTAAYPMITVKGPTSGPAVSRIELVNASGLVTFDVQLTLPKGSVLVGDMEARVTGAPRPIVTLDGQSKYGSWNLPRDPFHINPDPAGNAGFNLVYLRTTPPGAPVDCVLSYRDTWSG